MGLKVGFSDSESKPNILFRMRRLPCLYAQHIVLSIIKEVKKVRFIS